MKFTFSLVVVFIIYGSFYPFDFDFNISTQKALGQLNKTWFSGASRGDLLANIALFIPFGYTGLLAFPKSFNTVFRILSILVLAGGLGLGIQVIQIYTPSRDPNLFDGVLNILGAVFGMFFGLSQSYFLTGSSLRFENILGPRIALIASWFCYRLLPFIPSLDFQKIKNSWKPVFLNVDLTWVNAFHDAIAWAVVSYLWGSVMPKYGKRRYLLIAIVLSFTLESLIIDNVITASNVIGAIAGMLLWELIKKSPARTLILALSSVLSLVASSLKPFEFSLFHAPFHWIPFYGFLEGNMLVNTSVIFEKFFLLGGLFWLMFESINKWNRALFSILSIVISIEVAQMFFIGHLAEITDPLLVLVFASFLRAMTQLEKPIGQAKAENPLPASHDFEICISPVTSRLLSQFPAGGVFVKSLPFHFGRHPLEDEEGTVYSSQFRLRDHPPFQLSMNHLVIDREKDNLFVLHDLSRLGTVVNGVRIGRLEKQNKAHLKLGENKVIAGGLQSDFIFNIKILVE